MALELWLMSVGFVLMALMLLHRHIEERRGMAGSVYADAREKTDPVLRRVQAKANSALARLTWSEVALHAHNFAVYLGRFFMHVSYRTHRVSAKIVEKASQRKEDLSKRGAASFYMKQVREAKESSGEGEIVER